MLICWRRQWHPTPVLLPRKSHGWRSLVGCSSWGRWSQTRLSDFTFTFHFHALEKEMATHSNILAWRIPGMGEPGALPSMGSHRVRHDWSDAAAAACWFVSKCLEIFFFFLIYFNWRLITLQYCGGFCHTFTWISHGCICAPHPDPPSHLPPHPIPRGHPSAPALSTLSHVLNLDWRSVSHMIIYMF